MKKQTPFILEHFHSMLVSSALVTFVTATILIIDTFIAGHFLNDESLAAVGIVTPIFKLVTFLTTLVSFGTTILFPLEVGKFNIKRANEYFSQSLILSVLVGVVSFAAASFFGNTYFSYANVNEKVFEETRNLFIYYKFVFLFFPVTNFIGAMIHTEGDEFLSNLSNLAFFAVNIVASILLTILFGIKGISLGTLLAILSKLIICLFHFRKKSNTLIFKWHLNFKDFLHISTFSLVDSSLILSESLIIIILEHHVAHKYGINYITILTVIYALVEWQHITNAIGEATVPFINVYRGEKNSFGINELMKDASKIALFFGIFITVLIAVFAPFYTDLFSINNSEIRNISIKAVRIFSIYFIFTPLLFLMCNYYLTVEKTKLAVSLAILKDFALKLILIFALNFVLKEKAFLVGLAIEPIIAIALVAFIVWKIYGKDSFPFLVPKETENIYRWNIEVSPEEIGELLKKIKVVADEKISDSRKKARILLLIEESFMIIHEKNKDSKKEILAECTLILKDSITLIFRDNGLIFDITEENPNISSLRSFVLSSLMVHESNKNNLITTSYNRNVFRGTLI